MNKNSFYDAFKVLENIINLNIVLFILIVIAVLNYMSSNSIEFILKYNQWIEIASDSASSMLDYIIVFNIVVTILKIAFCSLNKHKIIIDSVILFVYAVVVVVNSQYITGYAEKINIYGLDKIVGSKSIVMIALILIIGMTIILKNILKTNETYMDNMQYKVNAEQIAIQYYTGGSNQVDLDLCEKIALEYGGQKNDLC